MFWKKWKVKSGDQRVVHVWARQAAVHRREASTENAKGPQLPHFTPSSPLKCLDAPSAHCQVRTRPASSLPIWSCWTGLASIWIPVRGLTRVPGPWKSKSSARGSGHLREAVSNCPCCGSSKAKVQLSQSTSPSLLARSLQLLRRTPSLIILRRALQGLMTAESPCQRRDF